jgi:hypothetical protein
MAKLVIALAIIAFGATLKSANAATAYCNLPRALLCEGCASGIVVTLTPGGSCRVAFTPGTAGPTSEGAVPVTFVFSAPWRARQTRHLTTRPSPTVSGSSRCLVYNGNQYCE